ncbi:MAG: ergothioneine biosynthesis protein EgtB [Rhodospirillales bacterium]
MSKTQARNPKVPDPIDIAGRFDNVRGQTLTLAAPLSAEDQCIQSMPDTSPTKWHLAHTTWFFETFILKPRAGGYREFDPAYNYLFNSYYEQIGDRHARPERGMLTRPPLSDIHAFREHVDAAMNAYLGTSPETDVFDLIELGLHHEQQHQELLLTDIKHALSRNPLFPAYHSPRPADATRNLEQNWIDHPGGLVEIGHDGAGFAFDCEGPRHKVWLEPFRLATHPVSNGDFIEFIEDGGYRTPTLWLADGWAMCQEHNWQAPLYWHRNDDDEWRIFTLSGLRPVDPDAPVCHVSFYEADAYARWAGARLATEAEWEVIAEPLAAEGHFAGAGVYHPMPSRTDGLTQMFGDVWEWTGSAYTPYPGFQAPEGAVGEYNGKFMSGQMVLRGGSCATPEGHIRASYRNFFYPWSRWQFSGIRLAQDAPRTASGSAAPGTETDGGFRSDVLQGLASVPKGLPPKYFYDAEGARLFTEICELDEYYPTRTEIGILTENAANIASHIGKDAMLIEYGSGSLDKVRILLDALEEPSSLCAIDISADQLQTATDDVRAAYPGLDVLAVEADFTRAVDLPMPERTPAARVVFFPGSTIGNFDPADAAAFLGGVRETLGPGGMLLIGVDLKKDIGRLIDAYDDASGVTEAFNKNLLARINSELGGDFDLSLFRHIARYNHHAGRIEIHLESCTDQVVHVDGHAFHFTAGETIHTENSYKFTTDEFAAMAANAGFEKVRIWQDAEELFAVMLFRVAG